MPQVLFEAPHPGSFILGEAEAGGNTLSRDNVTLTGGVVIATGTVLAQNSAGSYLPLAPAASDGTQNAAGLSIYKYDVTAGDLKGAIIARDSPTLPVSAAMPG